MKGGQIDAIEYTIVSNCLLGMWLDGYLKDREYNQIMDRVNEYARKCGIRDKAQFERFNKSCVKGGD